MPPLTLPHVDQLQTHSFKMVVLSILQMRGAYIMDRDFEMTTCDQWDFWKLNVFRWSDASSGCGTRKSRDEMWERHQQEIRDLFEHYTDDAVSWRWLPHNGYDMSKPYDKVREKEKNYIVGRTFYIKKGPLLLDNELFNDL